MRVTAWMCDRCGRMRPGDTKPEGWFEVSFLIVQERGSDSLLFCSGTCTGLWFRSFEKARRGEEEFDEGAMPELSPPITCETCGWISKVTSKQPSQSLRMHIRRVHPGQKLEKKGN
jgi:hypothetical protein